MSAPWSRLRLMCRLILRSWSTPFIWGVAALTGMMLLNVLQPIIDAFGGKGIAPEHHIGVGMLAMQERASELGGGCTITRGASGGTTIQVNFPLGMTEDASPTSPSATTP